MQSQVFEQVDEVFDAKFKEEAEADFEKSKLSETVEGRRQIAEAKFAQHQAMMVANQKTGTTLYGTTIGGGAVKAPPGYPTMPTANTGSGIAC